METIGQQVEHLLDDFKRVASLLEDAASDTELLDSQPYQQARVVALRQQLFDIDLRLRNLRRELAKATYPLPRNSQVKEQYHLNIAEGDLCP